ncbi:hypothetical protein [Agromyces aureus]|uniref:WxL domain-containing protein n=1 Tax=Agromyces aureus TaxID=453304 RepID=A0A191WD01_9MICO|nr:hypothetical protein [Agromyces aureus]ANJ26141.1 hypothetical protein ATC03_04755 [Agromyces aureus]
MKRSDLLRCSAAIAGTLALMGAATAAFAEETHGEGIVEVGVEVAEISEPGTLALTVAGTSAVLTETGEGELIREFTGTLPAVTVTDTRSPDEIPQGAYWYVLGSATDFVGATGQAPIDAGHLGWTPAMIDGGESGLVGEGDPVGTVLDPGPNNVGLVDQELLAAAWDSGDVASDGQWTATAELVLRTPASVASGDYSSSLTLSLFE